MTTLTTDGWPYPTASMPNLPPSVNESERVAVVTGANQGLGFAIAQGLCEQFDGYVYLTARDKKKGAEAVQVLKDMNVCKNPDKVRFHELNVLNEDHVDRLFFTLRNKHRGIDILVNNAGIAYKRDSRVPFAEQAENTVMTNYLGIVRVCTFLFPLLRPHGRVVNLSSSAGHLSQISHFELKNRLMDENLTEKMLTDIMYEFMDITKGHAKAHVAAGWPDSAYAVSKIGVNLLTRIYQKKFDCMKGDRDLIINSVHPGYFASNISSYMGNINIYEAASAPLYCALLPPRVSEPRGQFVWSDCNIIDIDSPTTPERPDDIYEHDIVSDIRDYAIIYSSTPRYPPIGDIMRQEMEEYHQNKAKESTQPNVLSQENGNVTTIAI